MAPVPGLAGKLRFDDADDITQLRCVSSGAFDQKSPLKGAED